ncbi:MAG: bifunctional ADP-dependent NAD(P)H-hydrate dehydratase/NAD(P)H-hydrate epimerase [Sneathiella sp.]|nr:MAG: bifunctional ADP-dependent NAD(P)H-hydrate dehydratase/NAD(P)H-hydrate epimerase [Sneathiella sp.]
MELLSVSEMYQADRLAIEGGVSGITLMQAAGRGIATLIKENVQTGRCLVLCGPGNNGGDGYVVAQALVDAGWHVDIVSISDPDALTGDAAGMRELWTGPVQVITEINFDSYDLAVDALFGAGFSRELEPDVVSLLVAVKGADIPVIAVDVPSGVNGDTGAVDPGAIPAIMTVSFFRAKTGHYLYPARGYCGLLQVIDIGIDDKYLAAINPGAQRNDPAIWVDYLIEPDPLDHKYSRGHVAIVGGAISSTGAARMAARASLRAGAGATTVVSPPSALSTYAAALEAVMVTSIATAEAFADWIRQKRIGTLLIGPGNGVNDRTRGFVLAALEGPANVILDADALTVFKNAPQALFEAIIAKPEGVCILTPHEAEFNRIFDVEGSKLERAKAAAQLSGAIVLLKGADTVVATPQGRAIINHNAPPFLAAAGSGDVLGGIICGLISAGMPPFKAAAAATWIHGEAGNRLGQGLIAEDIESEIPAILAGLSRSSTVV